MIITLYKYMYSGGISSVEIPFEYEDDEEVDSDKVRTSEPVEVEFTPLSDAVVIEAQLAACDEKEKEIRNAFEQALNRLKDERARIQSLPHLKEEA